VKPWKGFCLFVLLCLCSLLPVVPGVVEVQRYDVSTVVKIVFA
jgi:hypothetical protein